jgi:hypothetical protein
MDCAESRRTGGSKRKFKNRAVKILSAPVYEGFGPTLAEVRQVHVWGHGGVALGS